MTHVGPAPTSITATDASASNGSSFVEWGAVLAGAVLAAALSFVLLTFGAAIGLSATSPWPNSGMSAKVIASIAVFWAMLQQIGSFMAGGYVAGRMRSRWHETTQHEVEFRDGLHGGLVWAVGVVIAAALFMATAGAATRAGTELASKSITSSTDAMDSVVDTMLRPMTVAQAGTPSSSSSSASSAPAATGGRLAATTNTGDIRAEISRILASSVASGSISDQNRAYLAQLISQRTGLSQQEADKRVGDAINTAREAADKARRATILAGFVTAASLIISFGAAWWAALKGGNHRDNSVPARFEFADRRRSHP